MKTWTLVWFLVFPPAGPNQDVTWEAVQETDLTQEQCFALLAEKDQEFKNLTLGGEVSGHEIYCREGKDK